MNRRLLAIAPTLLCTSLAHAADPPECHFTRIAEIPLSYSGPNLQVTTQGTINDKPVTVLVDTGAFDSMLTRTGTNRLGLPLHMSTHRASGIGGISRIYYARLKEFAFGPARSVNGMFPVIGDTGFSPSFDAIAGAPFLLQADLEINLPEKKMKFFRPEGCNDRFLAYWDQNASEIAFGYRGGSRTTPHFTVYVNGQPLDAIIDTGASASGMRASAARRIGLKLEGAKRLGNSVGVGDRHVAEWAVAIDNMVIGDETIQDTELGVYGNASESYAEGPDMLLGDDFLRSHRVLFAMSQQKLYISYVGGEPFRKHGQLDAWIPREAEAGNSDAQLALSDFYYEGKLVQRDLAKADAWLQKAAAQGNPRANLLLGERLLQQHRFAEAADSLHAALLKLPGERYGALALYLARVQAGQEQTGRAELEQAFANDDHDQWPTPVADFYLGHMTSTELMKAADDRDAELAKSRSCAASGYIHQLYLARGDREKAEAAHASERAFCTAAAEAGRGT